MKTLPNKPSALITLALNDLRKVERNTKKYKVNMNRWHQPNSHCSVCLAGSVMAKTLGADRLESIVPEDFPEGTANKLGALNEFRIGYSDSGFYNMGRSSERGQEFNRRIPEYDRNRTAFHKAMRGLARDLKAAGY